MGRNKNERFESCRRDNWAWKSLIALRARGNRKKAVGERVFCAGVKLEKEDVAKFCGDGGEFHAPSNELFAVEGRRITDMGLKIETIGKSKTVALISMLERDSGLDATPLVLGDFA